MSDRKNRDVGRKKEWQKYHHLCDCWLCTNGKTKKRLLKERQLNKQKHKDLEDRLQGA